MTLMQLLSTAFTRTFVEFFINNYNCISSSRLSSRCSSFHCFIPMYSRRDMNSQSYFSSVFILHLNYSFSLYHCPHTIHPLFSLYFITQYSIHILVLLVSVESFSASEDRGRINSAAQNACSSNIFFVFSTYLLRKHLCFLLPNLDNTAQAHIYASAISDP